MERSKRINVSSKEFGNYGELVMFDSVGQEFAADYTFLSRLDIYDIGLIPNVGVGIDLNIGGFSKDAGTFDVRGWYPLAKIPESLRDKVEVLAMEAKGFKWDLHLTKIQLLDAGRITNPVVEVLRNNNEYFIPDVTDYLRIRLLGGRGGVGEKFDLDFREDLVPAKVVRVRTKELKIHTSSDMSSSYITLGGRELFIVIPESEDSVKKYATNASILSVLGNKDLGLSDKWWFRGVIERSDFNLIEWDGD